MTTLRQLARSVMLLALLAPIIAGATLLPRLGDEAVYDTDLDVTWLADANLAATQTFGAPVLIHLDGSMNWSDAQSWIAAMDGANYLGFSGWRLPTPFNTDGSGPCSGFGCTGTEVGHLFSAELGGTDGSPLTGNQGPFRNMQFFYWLGTEHGPGVAWNFNFGGFAGFQGWNPEDGYQYAWAVRAGDVRSGARACYQRVASDRDGGHLLRPLASIERTRPYQELVQWSAPTSFTLMSPGVLKTRAVHV
jgi:hypothetical protein